MDYYSDDKVNINDDLSDDDHDEIRMRVLAVMMMWMKVMMMMMKKIWNLKDTVINDFEGLDGEEKIYQR